MNSENPEVHVIFGQALSLSDRAEREAFLDRSCAGNEALRREVESLLSAHAEAGDFLRPTPPAAPSDFVIERTGVRIGRYKLLEKIGEGGFGVVYMAEQVEPVQRKVALKIIKAGMDTKEVIARFEAERQALALMDHPNIARVLDAGATAAGRPYFVMELVRGLPITDYCDQKSLPTAERLRLFVRVCHAIQHAHQKGIIHRDLKPSNILVTLHDGVPVPKVIDFGVAKALGQKLTEKTVFTRFAQMVGTPAYMSPEQAELSGLDIDTRSDIYSLGVLLYELMTGVTPFDKETLAKAAFDEIRRMIRETEPPKPSIRVQTLGARLSEVAQRRQTEPIALSRLLRGDLDWIVMKCLDKDRQRRYESPGALAQDVLRHLGCEPVLASPPSAAYLLAKFVRRHRVGVSVMSMFVLALVIGLGSTLIALKRARQEQARAAAAATVATTIGDTIQRAMLGELGEAAGTNVSLPSRALLDQLAGNVQGQFHDQPLVEAAVRLALGRTYVSVGDYAAGERQVQRAADIRKKELGPEDPDTLEALGALGFLWFKQGKPAQAEAQLRQVLESQRRLLEAGDPAIIQTLAMLGAVQRPTGEARLTPDLLKTIRSMRNDDPRTLRALHSIVDTLRSEKQLLDAEALGRELAARQERVLGSNHTETVRGLLCLSYTLEALDRNAECEQLRREALRRARQTDPTGPDTAAAFRRLMDLITQRQDYPEAQRLLEEELEIEKRLLGAGHASTLFTERALARVALQNASAPAVESQKRANLAGAEAKLRLNESDPAAWVQRAMARGDLGDWSLAVEDFDQAVSRMGISKAPGNPEYAWNCLKLARSALAAAQLQTAEKVSREAVRVFKDLEGKDAGEPDHALGAGKSLWVVADALLATQRTREAMQVLDEAMRVFEQGTAKCPQTAELRQEQAFTHRKIAEVHASAGESDEAERHFRTGIEFYAALEKEFPTNTWYAKEEAYTTWQAAAALHRSGRRDAAEAAFRRAIDLYEHGALRFPKESEFNLRSRAIRLELATLLEASGKTAEAEALRAAGVPDGASPAPQEDEAPATPRRAAQVPPRPGNATPAMVDLTAHFHASLTETWHPGAAGNDLARLPSGVQTFEGVPFDVRGIVQLNGGGLVDMGGEVYPQRVWGIKVGQKCARLHFLHSCGWAVNDGTVVGSYVLHYADGSSQTLPIVYGLDVRDWWVGSDTVVELQNAQVAWQGQTSNSNVVRLYKRTWDNPEPDREIATIEFASAMTRCAPFLLAITTDMVKSDRSPVTSRATDRKGTTNPDKVIVKQGPTNEWLALLHKGDIKGAVEMFRRQEQPGLRAVRNPRNGHLYRRVDQPMSWPEGRAFCQELGGHLATVASREENDFIYQNFASDHVCWLGASDEAKEGQWQWVTGEPFIYTNWFRGEPNNDKGKEHFLAMGNHPTLAYRFGPNWNDHEVTGSLAGGPTICPVCEWDGPLPGVTEVKPAQTPAPPRPALVVPRIVLGGNLDPGSGLRAPPRAAPGQSAPPVKLELLEGGRLDLAAHLGTNIVVLAFWATWGPDSGASMPALAAIAQEYRGKGVALYAVNLNEPPERIRGFIEKTGCKLNVALDQDGTVADRYGIKGVTSIVIIGKDGRIQAIHPQAKPDLKDSLKLELDALLAGKPLESASARQDTLKRTKSSLARNRTL